MPSADDQLIDVNIIEAEGVSNDIVLENESAGATKEHHATKMKN